MPISKWAAKSGLTVSSVSPDRLLVRLSGPASVLGAALGTSLERYRSSTGREYVARRHDRVAARVDRGPT